MEHKLNANEIVSGESYDLEQRIAKANARKRSAQVQRDNEQERQALAREVEASEIEADDAEAIVAAELEHGAGRIAVVNTPMGCVIVKRPHPAVYKRFRDKGEAKTSDLDSLVRKSLAYPDLVKFDRIVDELPATLDRAANKVVELAGFKAKEVGGKS